MMVMVIITTTKTTSTTTMIATTTTTTASSKLTFFVYSVFFLEDFFNYVLTQSSLSPSPRSGRRSFRTALLSGAAECRAFSIAAEIWAEYNLVD